MTEQDDSHFLRRSESTGDQRNQEFFRRLSEISSRRDSRAAEKEYDYLQNEPGLQFFARNEESSNIVEAKDDDNNEHEVDMEEALVPLLIQPNRKSKVPVRQNFGKLDIPDSLLIFVLEFLPAKNVARLCRVSQYFKRFANSRVLWIHLRDRDFFQIPKELPGPELSVLHPKDEYEALYSGKLKLRNRKILTRKLRDSLLTCRYVQQILCFGAPSFIFASLMLLTFRLQKGNSSLSWLDMLPFLILICFAFLMLLWGSFVWVRGSCMPYFHWRTYAAMSTNFPLYKLSIPFCVSLTGSPNRLRSGMLNLLFFSSCLFATIILLILKATHVIQLSYWVTLIPAGIGNFSIILSPLTSCLLWRNNAVAPFLRNHKWRSAFLIYMLISLPLFLSALLLFLRLDGILPNVTVFEAFIPLFIQDVMILTFTLIRCQTWSIQQLVGLFAPWVAFQLFLSLRNWDLNSSTWSVYHVMSPLLLPAALFSLGGLVILTYLSYHYYIVLRINRVHDLEDPIESIPQ